LWRAAPCGNLIRSYRYLREEEPRLEVEGAGAFDVEEGKRRVLAIEEDAGVDILHDVRPKPQKR
jgi:hypothetical protein